MPILQDALQAGAATTAPQPQPTPQNAAPAPAGAGNLPPPNPQIVCPAVAAHMDDVENMRGFMDEKQRNAFDRVVVAGKKMLYAPESAQVVQNLLMDDEIPMANKLGEGVANLMVMMDNQGNGTIPKEIMIPAGIVVMFEAADYAFEVGFEISETDLADAMEKLIYGIYAGYQIPAEKVDEVIDALAGKFGFKEGDAEKVMGKVEEAQEKGMIREPIPGGDNGEEEAFEQGFNQQRGRM